MGAKQRLCPSARRSCPRARIVRERSDGRVSWGGSLRHSASIRYAPIVSASVASGRTGLTRHIVTLCAAILSFTVGWATARPHQEVLTSASSPVGVSRDIDTFKAIVSRLRAGESYYQVVGSELRRRGYPTLSVFNWRTPLLHTSISIMPPGIARAALMVLAGLLLVCTAIVFSDRSAIIILAGLVLQLGAVLSVMVPEAPLMSEAWTGVFIGLSVFAYSRQANLAGAGLGVLALFVRELAAPYTVLCTILAIVGKRKRELAIWAVGAVAYAVYFGWHFSEVSARLQPADLAHRDSWFYAGGLPVLSNTLRMNAFALVAPRWMAGALLGLIASGVICQRTPPHVRAGALTYVLVFLVIGQPFNYYWGLVTAPLWALTAAYGVEGVRLAAGDLGRAVRRPGAG